MVGFRINLHKHLFTTGVFLSGLFMSGCGLDNDDFLFTSTEGNVKIVMNWGTETATNPEGMSVLFYPTDGSSYWRFEIENDRGNAKLPVGTYNVLSFNNDTSTILFENIDYYGKALITTNSALLSDGLSANWYSSQPPTDSDDSSQNIITSPDMVWGANTYIYRRTGNTQTLTLYIQKLVAKYNVRIINVENFESVYQTGIAITGLSAGRYLSDMQLMKEIATIPGSLNNAGNGVFSGSINGFGHISGESKCSLWLYFNLRDGKKLAFQYDITSMIENAPDPFNVEILIDGVKLPEVETSAPDSGLNVGLDEWDIVEIELST